MWRLDNKGKDIAIIEDSGRVYTYLEVDRLQKKFANKVKQRELILVLCANNIETMVGYISCIINKIVVMFAKEDISEQALDSLLQSYNPKYIWKRRTNKFKVLSRNKKVYEYNDYELVETDKGKVNVFSELAMLLPTSGSTGGSKYVRISYKNLESNTKAIISVLDVSKTDKAITSLPINYTFGLSIINTHLFAGATILLTNKSIIQGEFWSFFDKYKGTTLAGVPYTYELIKKLNINLKKYNSLTTLMQAGGKMEERLVLYFEKISIMNGIKFYVMYGQTEATARISIMPFEKLAGREKSIGLPIEGVKMKIQDNEIVCMGQNVSLGYASNFRDLNKKDERKGVLHTGDLGYMDSEGFYYIMGRKDRLIKYNGYRLNLGDIEDFLKQVQGINSAVVFVNRILCIYITKEKTINTMGLGNDTVDKIINCLIEYTNISSKIFRVFLVDDFIRTSNNKVNYHRLEEDAAKKLLKEKTV